ncbi:hypothetical protein SAMN05443662_1178 [Sulfurivirga caldicuralii]|uniref:Uncharacterized protein n=1 Tax=Sulfurivirga caldicuralii TaxID=364032 RepID=A0A1N6G3Q1_9GAMM|nr:hypothetical protein [Sulfurivirga caldicuralii]SIO02148.1 hypothetical protein SAMN05443662_1178 [Sulfurivirga caldicuralii]
MLENIEVGARGWACQDYYPEDLPEEWQLDYYANAFSALLVPQAQWASWGVDGWEAFAESADTLRWIGFEWLGGDASIHERLLAGLAQLEQDGATEVGVLVLEGACPALPEYVGVTCKGAVAQGEWQWQALSGAPLGVVEVLPQDLKAQRRLLEDFAASLPDKNSGAPFIVVQGCANIAQLKQFKQLVELLGL